MPRKQNIATEPFNSMRLGRGKRTAQRLGLKKPTDTQKTLIKIQATDLEGNKNHSLSHIFALNIRHFAKFTLERLCCAS